MRRAGWIGPALLLAACSSTPNYPANPSAGAPEAAQPPPGRSPAPRPQVSAKDQCGAAAMQRLVRRPRSEIPVPLIPSRQRVACTTCPVTFDYSPGRLNFFFDADTGIIKEVRCG